MDILGFSSIKTEEARTTYNTDSACAWVSRANRKCRQLSRKRKLSFLAHDSALRPASPYTHTHATGSVPIWRKTLVICIKENREEGEREREKKRLFLLHPHNPSSLTYSSSFGLLVLLEPYYDYIEDCGGRRRRRKLAMSEPTILPRESKGKRRKNGGGREQSMRKRTRRERKKKK